MPGAGALISWLIFTPLAVYYVTAVGMGPLQLVLVGSVLEASIIVLEVPTGIVADACSRRLSVILGRLLFGAGFVIEGSVPIFAAILLAEVVRGMGETFRSGAAQAWLAGEVGEARAARLFLRAAQVRRACGLAGILAGTVLASVQLNLPVLIGGGLSIVLAGVLALAMPERGFTAARRPAHVFTTSLGHPRQRPLLLALLGMAAAAGASSEGLDRLWEAHLLANFSFPAIGALEPIVWVGIINAGAMLLGIAAVQTVVHLDTGDDRQLARVVLGVQAVWVAGTLAFGLTSSFAVAILALWSARLAAAIGEPLFEAWRTRLVPPEVRATLLSAIGQGDAIGQAVGGPLVGGVGTLLSLRAAMLAAGVLHLPVLALLARVHPRR